VLALGGAVLLVVWASLLGDPWKIVSFSIYGTTLVALFIASTLYHSIRGRAKALLRRIDHSAIYLLIAGTYTPFELVTLRGGWGWPLFGTTWALTAFGIVQEQWVQGAQRLRSSHRPLSLAVYLVTGWLAVAVANPLFAALGWTGMGWLVAGGLFYTGGIVFYLNDERWRHAHGIWHLFVLAGSASHWFAIFTSVA
jgi:hemolysin III